MLTNRRVVTGHNEDGASCVIFDSTMDTLPVPYPPVSLAWVTDGLVASNEGADDTCTAVPSIELWNAHNAKFILMEMQPGDEHPTHQTDTVDFAVVLSGRVRLTLDTEEVILGPGDLMVDRGARHAWTVHGDEPAVMVSVIVPAHPRSGKDA